jgi:hypothetical protein
MGYRKFELKKSYCYTLENKSFKVHNMERSNINFHLRRNLGSNKKINLQ